MHTQHLLSMFTAVLFLFSGRAVSGELYRCESLKGAVSFQSAPCSPEQTLRQVYAFQSEPPVVLTPQQSIRDPRFPETTRWRRASNYQSAYRFRAKPQLTDADRCKAAKSKRALKLEQLGLNRTYEQLSQLGEEVRSVCHGY